MIAVEQRTAFDCMTACLASVFEVPYEECPVLCDGGGVQAQAWHGILDGWLADRGWARLERLRHDDLSGDPLRCPWRFPGYWIAGVRSPRLDDRDHAVVMEASTLVWDPHPARAMGHRGFVDATYFLPLNPARFALRSA